MYSCTVAEHIKRGKKGKEYFTLSLLLALLPPQSQLSNSLPLAALSVPDLRPFPQHRNSMLALAARIRNRGKLGTSSDSSEVVRILSLQLHSSQKQIKVLSSLRVWHHWLISYYKIVLFKDQCHSEGFPTTPCAKLGFQVWHCVHRILLLACLLVPTSSAVSSFSYPFHHISASLSSWRFPSQNSTFQHLTGIHRSSLMGNSKRAFRKKPFVSSLFLGSESGNMHMTSGNTKPYSTETSVLLVLLGRISKTLVQCWLWFVSSEHPGNTLCLCYFRMMWLRPYFKQLLLHKEHFYRPRDCTKNNTHNCLKTAEGETSEIKATVL